MPTVRPAKPDLQNNVPVLRDVLSHATDAAGPDAISSGTARVAPLRLAAAPPHETSPRAPLSARRQNPWLLVAVDETPASYVALIWALREAARREATVVAVSVGDGTDGIGALLGETSTSAPDRRAELEARVQRATAESGVTAAVRTAVLDPQVFAALAGAARGADLVFVGAQGKTLLRPAVPRPAPRRITRGA